MNFHMFRAKWGVLSRFVTFVQWGWGFSCSNLARGAGEWKTSRARQLRRLACLLEQRLVLLLGLDESLLEEVGIWDILLVAILL